MVSSRWTVSVAVRLKTHREKEVTLGAFRTGRIINWIRSRSSLRFQHPSHRNRHHRIINHARKPSRALRSETHSWADPNGRHLQPKQDIRRRRRHGKHMRMRQLVLHALTVP